jgi:membrane-associated phospholipid phosphatase
MSKINKLILLSIFLFRIDTGFAQNDSSRASFGSTICNDGKTFLHNAGGVFSSPAHFTNNDWFYAGGIITGTAILFAADEPVRKLALRNQSKTGDDLFWIGREYGRIQYALVLSGVLYTGGLVFKHDEIRITGMMVFESVVFAGAITTVLKSTIGRARPYLNEGNWSFRGIQFNEDRYSLPSGHSTVAFAVSSTLAGKINNTWATVGLYSLATITAFSRIYNDEHWVSDNFLGAAIGTSIGIAVVNLHKQREESHTVIRIVPSFNGFRAELIFN